MRRQGCGKESLSVGVERMCAQLETVGELDNLPEIHDRDTVADMGHRREVVANEQIADPQRLLQLLQLVHDLRPDGNIQRRNRLVQHNEAGIGRQRSRYRDPLALPAAELVGE
jgi:hypothetical protein